MGSAIARRMAENGARVLTSLKGRSQATVDRAHQAGMISASDEEIAAHAELVLSVVPPGEALALAEHLQPVFERQSRRPIFMDCNAVNPSTPDSGRCRGGDHGGHLSPEGPMEPTSLSYIPCGSAPRRWRRDRRRGFRISRPMAVRADIGEPRNVALSCGVRNQVGARGLPGGAEGIRTDGRSRFSGRESRDFASDSQRR
jgi:hypothetical protein